jgi:hypothetical protein
MSPDFKTALQMLGWDQYQAAEHLGKGLRTINRYANGGPVPLLVERELQRAIEATQRKGKRKRA